MAVDAASNEASRGTDASASDPPSRAKGSGALLVPQLPTKKRIPTDQPRTMTPGILADECDKARPRLASRDSWRRAALSGTMAWLLEEANDTCTAIGLPGKS